MSSTDRQRIERVPGSRRVKLTAAPGTTEEPTAADAADDEGPETGTAPGGTAPASGPNDDRLRRDVPPHY